MRRVLITGLLAGLLVVGTACSAKPSSSASSGAAAADSPSSAQADDAGSSKDGEVKQINKTITVKDDENTADITLVSVSTVTEAGKLDIKPESGTFVVFDLKIVCKKGEFSTNSLYVWLKTAAGKKVEGTDGKAMLATVEPDLPLKDLTPGQGAAGKVVLDSKLEPGSKMVWVDPLDKELASWDL